MRELILKLRNLKHKLPDLLRIQTVKFFWRSNIWAGSILWWSKLKMRIFKHCSTVRRRSIVLAFRNALWRQSITSGNISSFSPRRTKSPLKRSKRNRKTRIRFFKGKSEQCSEWRTSGGARPSALQCRCKYQTIWFQTKRRYQIRRSSLSLNRS